MKGCLADRLLIAFLIAGVIFIALAAFVSRN
jgi:hypothetical protein